MRTILITLAVLAGCNDNPEPGDTTSEGHATYRDAATEHEGTPAEPASPEPQPNRDPMVVEVLVEGTGSFDVGAPECQADSLTGAFGGLLVGEGEVGSDGSYFAVMSRSDTTFETPSGCELPSLEVGLLTSVVVHAELSATRDNCESYCEAQARAEGESECGVDPGAAECRSDFEADYAATCTQECTSETHAIVAESELSADQMLALQGLDIAAEGMGALQVDLVFDRVEDDQGDPVETGR